MTTPAHEPCAEGEAAERSDPNAFNDSVIQEFRANGGIVGGELAHMQLLLLTTIGAKSGRPHTTPLAYHKEGDRYFVIASNGGAPTNPDWYHNLRTHPRTTVEISTEPSKQSRPSSTPTNAIASSSPSQPKPRLRANSKHWPDEPSPSSPSNQQRSNALRSGDVPEHWYTDSRRRLEAAQVVHRWGPFPNAGPASSFGHRGSGFGPVAVTSRCGTQSSTCLKPSKRAPSRMTPSYKERR